MHPTALCAKAATGCLPCHFHRYIVILVVETERSGHAAASCVQQLPAPAEFVGQRGFAVHAEQRLPMSMPVHDDIAFEHRPLKIRSGKEVDKRYVCAKSVRAMPSCGYCLSSASLNTDRQAGSRPTTRTPSTISSDSSSTRFTRLSPGR